MARILIPMYGRITAAALFLITFLLFAGCAGQKQQEKAPEPEPQPLPPDTGEELPPLELGCLVKKGIERDACLKQEALEKWDRSKCYLIGDNATREECVYPFALQQPELCSDLKGSLRDDCYVNAANMTASKEKCGLVEDAAKKAACLGLFKGPCDDESPVGYNRSLCEAGVAKDVSKCFDGGGFGDACAFDYALKFKESGACGRIGDEAVRYACLTILSKDEGYCGSANATEKKDLCRIIAARELGDAGICTGVALGSTSIPRRGQ